MRFANILLVSIGLYAGLYAQPPEPVSDAKTDVVEDVYLAKDDGKGKAGDVVESFSTGDIPIHCIVMLVKADPVAVKMNLVAVKVAGVKPESRVVSTGYTTKQGQDRVFFTGRPDGKWTAGTYRVDVFVGGKKERSLTFEIRGSVIPAAATQFSPPTPKPKPLQTNKN